MKLVCGTSTTWDLGPIPADRVKIGSRINNSMAANGISTLPTRQARQQAKLDLAQTKRQAVGTNGFRSLNTYDLDLLPTKYSGNTLVDNPNPGGLMAGRPWTEVAGAGVDNLTLEDGSNLLLEDDGLLLLE